MSPPLSDTQAARVERHAALVRKVARQFARAAGTRYLSVDELESVGNEALVTAAMRYDPNGPASFTTYAHYRIYGAMRDALRRRNPNPRDRGLARLEASTSLCQQAAEDHAAARANGSVPPLVERVGLARALIRQVSVAALLASDEDGDRPLADRVAADQTDPESRVVKTDARQRLAALVAELDGHDRDLIEALYVHGRTMQGYAAEIGTSVSTISRRHARILTQLGKRLRAIERGAVRV